MSLGNPAPPGAGGGGGGGPVNASDVIYDPVIPGLPAVATLDMDNRGIVPFDADISEDGGEPVNVTVSAEGISTVQQVADAINMSLGRTAVTFTSPNHLHFASGNVGGSETIDVTFNTPAYDPISATGTDGRTRSLGTTDQSAISDLDDRIDDEEQGLVGSDRVTIHPDALRSSVRLNALVTSFPADFTAAPAQWDAQWKDSAGEEGPITIILDGVYESAGDMSNAIYVQYEDGGSNVLGSEGDQVFYRAPVGTDGNGGAPDYFVEVTNSQDGDGFTKLFDNGRSEIVNPFSGLSNPATLTELLTALGPLLA